MASSDGINLLCFKKDTLHSVKVSSSPNLPLLFAVLFWGETQKQIFADILQNKCS